MFESRCGILCSRCDYKVNGSCPGCLKQQDAFWGHCLVKGCCENRAHDHCGQCPDFVCKLAHGYAYDMREGDQGERIRNCKRWARAEEEA